MAFSSGTFTLVAGNPVVTATTISSTVMNNTLSDIATGLSTCILKDGTQTCTAAIPFAQGITIPTGKAITGTGTASITGFGAISSSDAQTNTGVTGTSYRFLHANGSGTGWKYLEIDNTGGVAALGVERSTGGGYITGSTGYDAFLAATVGISMSADNGTTLHLRIGNTGTVTIPGALALSTTSTPTGTGTGVVGQLAWDTSYLYVCTATNDWRRVALTDF